jgi:hypothetical protein
VVVVVLVVGAACFLALSPPLATASTPPVATSNATTAPAITRTFVRRLKC